MATDSTRRLHHSTPAWVGPDAIFHIRVRILPDKVGLLANSSISRSLLNSASFYHRRTTWFCHLFLIMPDHLHALLGFAGDSDMRVMIGRWKAWQTRQHQINWQDNFFDHRIRNARELQLKAHYIRQNPVVKGLCPRASDWPWVIDSTQLDPADSN